MEDHDQEGDGDALIGKAEEEAQKSKVKLSMMQKINQEKERRVTAKVVGVIKPMNKTYGGSILKSEDHSEQTH
jgi:hypothetical protein